MKGFQVNRPFCVKIGVAGVALSVLGIIFHWSGTQFRKSPRLEMVSHDRVELILRSLEAPQVKFRLVRSP